MAGDLRGVFRGHLRTLFEVGTTTGLTDGQLLERFATRRDEGSELAFAHLVQRHGPMVLRACRGILHDDHEAMDAFQATFLVLARKGGSLWVRDSLGPWLHRVACHAAGRAKSTAARRRATEKKAVEMAAPRNVGEDREELASVIHEEVNRLPERYRSAVVLCDLEGRTCEEAARHLGCPVGTVGSRLSRGRQRLRDRLSRRGLVSGTVAWPRLREPIPPELVGSTAGAAARFISIQAVPHEGAALLALGVLRSMATTRWWKVASVLLALTASTSGVVALVGRGAAVAEARPEDAPKAAQPDDGAVIEVRPGKLTVVVEERGLLEAARSSDVFCMVEGQATITSIVPEDNFVTKGQVVCELDSASLKDELTNQVIAVKKAEAALEDARLTREFAELAVQVYVDEVYPADFLAASNALALAESSMTRAEERLKRTRTAVERLNAMLAGQGGTKTPADIVATLDLEDRLATAAQSLDQRRRALEIGRAKRDVLEKRSKDRTVKQLRIEVDKTRPVELARQASCEMERAKEAKLRRQIASCQILAAADGMMIYARIPNPSGARPWPRIEEGATIRERQKIFTIADIKGPMRVVAQAHEAMVDRLSPGQTARVHIDAFPNETFLGVVETVAPRPDQTTSANSGVKLYPTNVAITKGKTRLRPGFSASVEILVAELDNVLSVPIQAVVTYDEKYQVAVKTPAGGVDWRDVTLGLSNDQVVEVKEGLKTGEAVALEPGPLLSEAQKREKPILWPKPKPPGPEIDLPKAKK